MCKVIWACVLWGEVFSAEVISILNRVSEVQTLAGVSLASKSNTWSSFHSSTVCLLSNINFPPLRQCIIDYKGYEFLPQLNRGGESFWLVSIPPGFVPKLQRVRFSNGRADELFTLLFLYQQMLSVSGSSVVLFWKAGQLVTPLPQSHGQNLDLQHTRLVLRALRKSWEVSAWVVVSDYASNWPPANNASYYYTPADRLCQLTD